jgi:hypothetical protein
LSKREPRVVAELRKEVAAWEAELDRSQPRFLVR